MSSNTIARSYGAFQTLLQKAPLSQRRIQFLVVSAYILPHSTSLLVNRRPETFRRIKPPKPTFRMYEVGLIDGGAVSTHSATLINRCVSVLPPEEQRFAIRLPVPSTRTEPTHSEGFQAAACPPWPLEPATFNPVLTRCVSAVKGAF